MAAQTGPGARLTGAWHRPRPHSRRERRRRQIGPVVEALEGRLVLASAAPTSPVPIGAKLDGTRTPSPAGVVFQQAVAIQSTTLQSLGDSYRDVQAAGAQLASRAAVAIDQLDGELRQSKSQRETDAIAAAVHRDRDLLDLGGADVIREEQGLDVARGLADAQATTTETDLLNGLFTTFAILVQQDQSTGTAISRSGRRSENAVARELNKLGDQLTSTIDRWRSR
jgi:hypothetical protein